MAERAYRSLRDRLIMLEIAPGDPINEGEIAADLGFGRTPIREALKRLETDHLVISYPRRGTFATIVDIGDLASISEMRRLLEPLAARKAALNTRNIDRAAFEQTAQAIARFSPSDGRELLLEYDLLVHRLIYQSTGNPHLEETLIRLDNLATRIWCLVLGRLPEITENIREHVDLLEAILDGRPDDAERLTSQHIQHFEATIRAAL
ncbi:GntR family transcriptional regulator [Zhihengliuella halotolerans]|nr:GntR family transcriptional regulator [Zhihengliuella halotolerans]